jgi:predicted anti-sigma-YlaC factor YlaD
VITCDELIAALTSYLDDEASARVRADVEAHIGRCRTCRVLYDTTRRTLRVVTDSGSFELPEEVSARVVERIAGAVRARGKGKAAGKAPPSR